MSEVRLISAVLLTVAFLVGCGSTELRTDASEIVPNLDDLKLAKKPLHAGVYFSPEFAHQQHVRVMGPTVFVVPIGSASVEFFDELLPKVFAKTSRVSNLSPQELAAKGVDIAIAPTLEYFNWRHGFDSDGPSRLWSVSYRMTLYSPRSVPVASWVVSGDDPEGDGGFGGAQKDLKDAAAKFMSAFEREAGPALAAIARNRGGKTAMVDPRDAVVSATVAEMPRLDPKAIAALQKAGVVPVRITAKGTSGRRLVMRGTDTRLRLKNGQIIEPSTLTSILNDLQDEEEGYNSWFTGAFFLGSLGGMAAGIADTQSQAEQREADSSAINKTLFSDRKLDKGHEESGIVLFRLPAGSKTSEGASLTAWIVEPATADGAEISVAITGFENVPEPALERKPPVAKRIEQRPTQKVIRKDVKQGLGSSENPFPAAHSSLPSLPDELQGDKATVVAPDQNDRKRKPTPSDNPFPADPSSLPALPPEFGGATSRGAR